MLLILSYANESTQMRPIALWDKFDKRVCPRGFISHFYTEWLDE